ncbi:MULTISPECIES: aminoacyl-histidine dipeptidase [unclassified Apibacter]|uniref:aminoacyl-histidine dipeptidase n=1 Tax=unclassified Apibacter TaxID=2630820 RepID=UPI0013219573|nr:MULTISPECIES: aminoacyl-histidine dipeptidase [unclassified Apibacter]MCX8676404.1 aminoacyl-histidine dipeptidase [Apibacter sp. B3919]MXO23868.1 beta-Ala-His dipeptidase [Apibacter sp. B3924]MXO26454.1 beta-Ala-His dipeptidase [Apibacter sp. B3813]MXO28406.1 beta-Ala-His dipeptidase [Apibacter sp. B3913]MXO30360.1 beta-Ala-His dipeptidase [Apibacter sp. B3912]
MNNNTIKKLKPESIWNHFADLNSVPRPSKKEEKVIKFIKDFGASLHLETIEDICGNVVIKKPATPGYENRKKVVLQSHLDMVCQKNNDVDFDFETQGIQMTYEGDWVHALGTTLGADNGIGVAAIMSVLSSKDIEHPAIEALFTIDEETGLTGAFELSKDILSGDILLNLDTEEDDEIDIGCAGGIDVTAKANYEEKEINKNSKTYRINLSGLHGGHSGMEIHKGLGNSNKLLNRFLYDFLKFNIQLISFDGGGLRNAIPREASAIFSISSEFESKLQEQFNHLYSEIKSEFSSIDSNLTIQLSQIDHVEKGLSVEDSKKFISSLQAAPNGVFRMSPDIEGLVEASNNIARVKLEKGKAEIQCLTRSSVESSKMWVATSLEAALELGGMKVELTGSYPGWKPNPSSEILKLAESIYEKKYGEKPSVQACHAGLECGIIGEKYPSMDMISFGPTIKGAHSPKERVSISSVQKFWDFLLEILKNIPVK